MIGINVLRLGPTSGFVISFRGFVPVSYIILFLFKYYFAIVGTIDGSLGLTIGLNVSRTRMGRVMRRRQGYHGGRRGQGGCGTFSYGFL